MYLETITVKDLFWVVGVSFGMGMGMEGTKRGVLLPPPSKRKKKPCAGLAEEGSGKGVRK